MILRQVGKVDRSRDRGSSLAIFFSITAAAIGAGRIVRYTHFLLPGTQTAHLITGACLVAAGSSLRLWSIHTLGRFFRSSVMIQESHRVIRSGPYRLVRHPSYSAILINLVGLGAGLGNWLAMLLIVVGGAIGLAIRIRVEEQTLAQALGHEYAGYMKETKRLIPFIL